MKLICNYTDLSNKEIGIVLDELKKHIDTIYYGKIEVSTFEIKNRWFKVEIYYLKRYTKFVIYELKKENRI